MKGGGAVVVADSGVCVSVPACVHTLCHHCHGNCGVLVALVVAFESIDRRESRRTSKVKLHWSHERISGCSPITMLEPPPFDDLFHGKGNNCCYAIFIYFTFVSASSLFALQQFKCRGLQTASTGCNWVLTGFTPNSYGHC